MLCSLTLILLLVLKADREPAAEMKPVLDRPCWYWLALMRIGANLLIYYHVFTFCVFNMAAPTGKFLKQTSAILSRLKHVCALLFWRNYLWRGLPSLYVENYRWHPVRVRLYCRSQQGQPLQPEATGRMLLASGIYSAFCSLLIIKLSMKVVFLRA